ncbi:MAG TPA: cation:proton antiporter [Candidatus Binatia bacterium]
MKGIKRRTQKFLLCLALAAAPLLVGAASEESAGVLLALAVLLPAAKLAGWLAERAGQPAVLGELLAGIVIGNLTLFGYDGLEYLKKDPALETLAAIGVILLLFEVGLESSLADLIKVGVSSLLVAVVGVVLPFVLGWAVCAWLLPKHSYYAHAFIGAALSATSVGITARVLRDMGRLKARESSIILGAAVIDDVLGLVILAVVTGMIAAAGAGAPFTAGSIAWLVAKVIVFLAASLTLGLFFAPRLMAQAARANIKGLMFVLSLSFCFALAYIAALIGLAAIVGAFAAGLILQRVPWSEHAAEGERSMEDLLHPVSAFLVPLFFAYTGLQMNVTWLARPDVLALSLALTAAAIAGKQACGLAVVERGLNRVAIGVGMIPRGEVGLIFAGIGLTLHVGGERIVDDAAFAAVVVMVMLTTLVSPPLLQWSFGRKK